ncbi:MAG: GTPase Era [bacterium]|nr:MAG: GTPase Era [bacterium]
MGRPNSGKSTLLNFICGEKVAIVSKKPQTTRNRILAVKTLPQAQIIILDTPGLHDATAALNKNMVKAAGKAAKEADLLLFLCDLRLENTEEDIKHAQSLMRLEKPMMVAINKIDLTAKEKLLPVMDLWSKARFSDIYPVSALHGDGVEELLGGIIKRLPVSPRLFPEDTLTQHSERFLVAETIREKLFNFTHQEIPYSSAVRIEEYHERSEKLNAVRAIIYVEKDSQKGIVIGQNGSMIKRIGQAARKELEKRFGKKFYLELGVKTRKDWTRDETFLKRLDSEFSD